MSPVEFWVHWWGFWVPILWLLESQFFFERGLKELRPDRAKIGRLEADLLDARGDDLVSGPAQVGKLYDALVQKGVPSRKAAMLAQQMERAASYSRERRR